VLLTPTKTRRLALLAATFIATAALSAAVVTSAAAQEPPAGPAMSAVGHVHLWLPKPTGPYPVGVRSNYVSDPSRIDDATGRARELPLRVWYPARKHSHGPSAPYLSPFVQGLVEDAVAAPAGTFDIGTHATTNAKARPHPRGVVLVQPGGGSVTAFQTGLIIELASRGYAVVAMEIPHESEVVEQSDGTVVWGDGAYPFASWRLDAQVVLDDLARLVPQANPRTPIGMFGHSRGGAATVDTMFHDARIRAGVSLDTGVILWGSDPTPPSAVTTEGLDQPLGLMCSVQAPCSSPYLLDFVSRLRGPHREKELNILHNGYTDFVVFNAEAAQADPVLAATLEGEGAEEGWPTGVADSLRAGRDAMAAQRDFLGDFMDRHLGS
jgi:hypothetical protein